MPYYIQTAVVAVAVVCATCLSCVTVSILVSWNSAVVRASSRTFSLVILLSLIAFCLCTIIYTADPGHDSRACLARWWINSLPLVLVLGALFGKTDRVNQVRMSYVVRAVHHVICMYVDIQHHGPDSHFEESEQQENRQENGSVGGDSGDRFLKPNF